MDNEPKHEKNESLTTAEEIIFLELQAIGQKNFSLGGALEEDADALQEFITYGRKTLGDYLEEKRLRITGGMNQYELKVYNAEESIILAKFDYLFLHPDTQAEYHEI